MITVENLSFTYRKSKRAVLHDFSLSFESGRVYGLLGKNGAGKSTFLKIISGEIKCKHGAIGYNGHDIHTLKSRELAEVRAVMPQHTQVNFPFTVQEVVELGLISTKAKDPT